MMETIGKTILERRRQLGITQQELATLSGVGINTLVAIERDSGNPSIKILSKVADVLGLRIALEQKNMEI